MQCSGHAILTTVFECGRRILSHSLSLGHWSLLCRVDFGCWSQAMMAKYKYNMLQVWGIPGAQVVQWEEVWTGGMRDSDSRDEASHRQEHGVGSGECCDGHASQRPTQRPGQRLPQTSRTDLYSVRCSRGCWWCELMVWYWLRLRPRRATRSLWKFGTSRLVAGGGHSVFEMDWTKMVDDDACDPI